MSNMVIWAVYQSEAPVHNCITTLAFRSLILTCWTQTGCCTFSTGVHVVMQCWVVQTMLSHPWYCAMEIHSFPHSTGYKMQTHRNGHALYSKRKWLAQQKSLHPIFSRLRVWITMMPQPAPQESMRANLGMQGMAMLSLWCQSQQH